MKSTALGWKIPALGLNLAADLGVPFPACLSLNNTGMHFPITNLSVSRESGFHLLSSSASKKHTRPKGKSSWVSSRGKRKKWDKCLLTKSRRQRRSWRRRRERWVCQKLARNPNYSQQGIWVWAVHESWKAQAAVEQTSPGKVQTHHWFRCLKSCSSLSLPRAAVWGLKASGRKFRWASLSERLPSCGSLGSRVKRAAGLGAPVIVT